MGQRGCVFRERSPGFVNGVSAAAMTVKLALWYLREVSHTEPASLESSSGFWFPGG